MSRSSRNPRSGFLPPDATLEPPHRLTPKLALRVAILGVGAVILFSLLFLRLWSLQVISGDRYRATAQGNQERIVRIEAPRGAILDRTGRPLVVNGAQNAIEIWPADMPKNRVARAAEIRRLATLAGVPVGELRAKIAERRGDPLTPVVVRASADQALVSYLLERKDDLPGVRLSQAYVRRYPRQTLAAQVLGHVGEISGPQLKSAPREAGYLAGDLVGQAGVESAYDRYLRGSDGAAAFRVDSFGRTRGRLQIRKTPQTGNALRLTIDLGLQRAAERALRFGIDVAHRNKNPYANGGAIVALDPRDGAVLAMASNPTYKPSIYSGRVDPKRLAPLADPAVALAANYPILNRAVQGLYPPGSTFKPVTALAALQERLLAPYQSLPCTSQVTIAKQVFRNWNPGVDQQMTLPTALAASCDTYFYRVGYDFYQLPTDRGQPLQRWASRFGFGKSTGIDFGSEEPGLLPTIGWRHRVYTRKTDPCCWQIDRLWKPGDSVQLAIGQKDLLATPLQMARFYALIANGGKLVSPYTVTDVERPGDSGASSRVLRRFGGAAARPAGVDPAALAVIRDGLYGATHASYGTSSGIFGQFPVAISGKTGTAEKVVTVGGSAKLLSQSWWCGYGPSAQPTIVVCALIENGGFGAQAAAPAALQVFQQFFGVRAVRQSLVASD